MHQLLNIDKPLLLVFPYNVMAHYLRCLQLASYLQVHFRIKFLYSTQYDVFVKEAGFETFACETLNAEKVQECVASFDFSWLNENDLSRIFNAQVKVIDELDAAAVLGDTSPTLKMAAEKTGVFHFSLINGYMSRYYSYVRRVPRSYPLYKLVNALPVPLANYFIAMGEQYSFHDIHRPFSKIRKRADLAARHSYLQELEGDVNLLCDLPEIFPQKDLPPNYYFIPPLFHLPRSHGSTITEKLDPNKKTLYVSMGSTGSWQKVAFLNNLGFRKYNIITAGDHQKIIQGTNVFSYKFINSQAVFEKADLVICHGGNGTTYQALSYGIPVLCKTTHLEQEYNVDGLERLGVGKLLDDVTTDKECLAATEELINTKGSKELGFIQRKIAASTGEFSTIIEDLVASTFFKQNVSVTQ